MVEKDFLLKALLCHNYLPTARRAKEELPPFFNTERFTPDVARELVKISYRKGAFSGYDQVEYKLTRFNSVSRLLSVPHPLPYANLCLALHDNWEQFEYIVNSPSSQIKPQTYTDGRVIVMNGYGDSVEKANKQLNGAFGMRYRVTTDIANCFPSIYSHAVPWALVGFEEAKAKRGRSHAGEWFNQIDKHLRLCKREETQGVAIGPATSSIIAEAILGRVDEELLKQNFRFVRYIDDYCCHCETEERAQDFVRAVEREAAKFKLQLNIKKTEFARLPQPVTDSWVVELGRQVPPKDSEWSAFEVFRYLDYAVALAERHPEGSVLKFAANIVANAKLDFMGNIGALNYLLTLAFHRPELLPVLTRLIEAGYINFGDCMLDRYESSAKLNRIAQENARLQRSDGMCWSLFHLGRLGAQVSDETANAIVASRDAMAMLALWWASDAHRGLVVDFSLDKTDLYELDRYWILLYQLFLGGDIDNPYPYDDKVFETLKEWDVDFLRPRDEFLPKEPMPEAGDGVQEIVV